MTATNARLTGSEIMALYPEGDGKVRFRRISVKTGKPGHVLYTGYIRGEQGGMILLEGPLESRGKKDETYEIVSRTRA